MATDPPLDTDRIPFFDETNSVVRRIVDAIPDALLVIGRDGRIHFANRQAELLLGYSLSEMTGMSHDVIVPEHVRTVHARHVARYLEKPTNRAMGRGEVLQARRKDGSTIPVDVSLSPLGDGPHPWIVTTLRDATERQRLLREKETNLRHLENAFSLIPDAAALFDADDRLVVHNEVFRLQRFCRLAGPIVGRTYEELVDLALDQMAPRSSEERARLRAERLELRDRCSASPARLESPDGRCFSIFERKTTDGGVLLVVRDITTENREAAEREEARSAAEAANHAKSEFLSSMSHELRTPLNAIVGFAQLLRRDKRDPLSAEGKERVDQILRAGNHLANLVDDILDLSRIEAGKLSVSIDVTGVTDILASAREALESSAERRDVDVEQVPLEDERLAILADRTRLIQVVTNLGSNAIKYNKPGGKVVLSAHLVRDGWVRISVTDTGQGIPLEKQALLFQPFERAGQEMGPIEGTGIGLVISRRLAEMMGGTVGFESAPGKGSRFWIDVPVSSQRVSRSTPPPDPQSFPVSLGEASRRVLYVEDNPSNVALMKALIASIDNVSLRVASTAEDGVRLAKADHPNIIFMDIHLPGMSGLEALRLLRSDPETATIPVVALTAVASTDAQNSGVEAGFFRYLTKPVSIEALLEAITSADAV